MSEPSSFEGPKNVGTLGVDRNSNRSQRGTVQEQPNNFENAAISAVGQDSPSRNTCTHTRTCVYIYIYTYACLCMYSFTHFWLKQIHIYIDTDNLVGLAQGSHKIKTASSYKDFEDGSFAEVSRQTCNGGLRICAEHAVHRRPRNEAWDFWLDL